LSADHQIDLKIVSNNDGSFSTTVATPGPARPGKVVKWVISAERFPQDSDIYIRFFERDLDGVKVDVDGCVTGSTFNHGIGGKGAAGKNGRLIEGKVKLTSHGVYSYEVRYIDAAGDHLLGEQEIAVEGTPEIPAKITRRGESGLGVRAAKSGSGVRPPAKRASGVRPAATTQAKGSRPKAPATKGRKKRKG
jgi:hypothetical protein